MGDMWGKMPLRYRAEVFFFFLILYNSRNYDSTNSMWHYLNVLNFKFTLLLFMYENVKFK